MTDTVFETPFFVAEIEDTGDIEILFPKGAKTSQRFYTCGDGEDSDKTCRAINLLWQAITYGAPDPKYKEEFVNTFGPDAYGASDVNMFAGAMMAIGAIPDNFHEMSVH